MKVLFSILLITIFSSSLLLAQRDILEKQFLESPSIETTQKIITGLLLQRDQLSEEYIGGVEERISAFVQSLSSKKLATSNLEKKVKYIFEEVHNEFFKKYELLASFDEIFDTGMYNCVSASALYALVFDQTDIDYDIVSTTNHVYIIADPNGQNIKVESTDPDGEHYKMKEKSKRATVKYLIDNKLIAKNEVAGMTFEQYYDTHFAEENEVVDLLGLIAYQYHNRGVELFAKEEKTKPAIRKLEIANQLHETREIKMLLSTIYNTIIISDNTSSMFTRGEYAVKIIELIPDMGIEEELFRSTFRGIYEYYLIEVDYPDSVKLLNEMVQSSALDSSYKNADDYAMQYVLSRKAHIEGNYTDALIPSIKLLHYEPRNVQFKSTVHYSMGATVASRGVKYLEEVVDSINQTKYGSWSLKEMTKLIVLVDLLDDDDERGFELLKEFEENSIEKRKKIPSSFVSEAYSAAWAIRVREANYEEAKAILERGLEIYPNDQHMNRKLRLTEEEQR